MMTFALALSAIVVAVGVVSAEFRCTPDQWEGTMGMTTIGCSGKAYSSYPKYSYDATNTRVATVWKATDKCPGVRIIYKFSEGSGTRYYIRGDKCCKFDVGGDFQKFCVPDGAQELGSAYYGLKGSDNTLDVDAFSYNGEKVAFILAITNDNVPTNFANLVKEWNIKTVAEYIDITGGIADPTVFDVPDTCNDACGKQDALLYLIQDNSHMMTVDPAAVEDGCTSLPGIHNKQEKPIVSSTRTEKADEMDTVKLLFQSRMKKIPF